VTKTSSDSTQVLCDEILAEARAQGETILRAARDQAAAPVARARAEAETARRDRLSRTRAEAARRRELLLATVPVEAGRLRDARIEALLQSVHDEVGRRLGAREGLDYRETLVRLAALAIRGMAGEAFLVALAPADRATLGPGLADEIAARAGRSPLVVELADDPAVEGGVIVRDSEGRQVWDNRLAARLERLWPELRRQLAVQAELIAGGVQ